MFHRCSSLSTSKEQRRDNGMECSFRRTENASQRDFPASCWLTKRSCREADTAITLFAGPATAGSAIHRLLRSEETPSIYSRSNVLVCRKQGCAFSKHRNAGAIPTRESDPVERIDKEGS